MREAAAAAGGGPPMPEEPVPDAGDSGAVHMMHVEEEVVRDLRHSVGNHFHKLYYWADRLGGDDDGPETRGELVESLNGALERFHRFLELGLKYFEPDRATLGEMGVVETARATVSVLRTELDGREVELEVDPALEGAVVRLDPQRFSLALRLLAGLLGGTSRDRWTCRFRRASDGDRLEVEVEARGGEAPVEIPVMEWAIARKTIVMQGGELRSSPRPEDEIGGCVVSLPFGG